MLSQFTALELSLDSDVKAHPDFRNIKIWKKCIFGHCKMNQVCSVPKSKAQPGLTIMMSEHLKTGPPLDTCCKSQRPEKRKLIPPFLLVLKAGPSASPVNLVLGPEVHSDFLYHLMGKPEQTFWPTQTLKNTLYSALSSLCLQ